MSGDGRVAFCRRVVSPQKGRGGWVHKLGEVAENFRRMGENLPALRQNAPAPPERRHQVNQALIGTLRLNDGERSNFRERGLDDRTTAGYEYRSTPTWREAAQSVRHILAQGLDLQNVPGFFRPDEGKDQWRMSTGTWHRGALIPVRDVDGSIQGFQIRRSEVKTFANPTTGKEEKEPRYVWLSSANRHGDSPGDPPRIRVDGASSGAPVHYRNVGHIRQTGQAIITEGALKADVIAHYLDRGVIGIAGVSSFAPDFGRELREKIPELRRAFVAFDADVVRKPEVRAALERLRQTLTEAGLEVSIGKWEERDGKGLDDLCQARLGRDFGQSMREDRAERQLALLREVGWTPYHPERSAPDMTASGLMMLDRPEQIEGEVVSRKSVRLDPGRTEVVSTQTQNSPASPDPSPSQPESPQHTGNEVLARNQAVEGKADPQQSEARPRDDLQKGWLALINASRAELGEAPLPERMGDILQGNVRPLRSDSQESPAGEIKLWAEAAERHMNATELKVEQIKDAARTFRDNITAARVADSWVIGVDDPMPQIRATPEKLHERIVLGAALSARLYLEVAENKLEAAREHGHTFRFDLSENALRHEKMTKVSADVLLQTDSFSGLRNDSTTDGLPDGRKVSALDIHRVADARAGRLASERDTAPPDERRILRGQYFKSGIKEQSDKLERHDQALTSLIEKLTDERDDMASRYAAVRPEAEIIQRRYGHPGEMPVPLMERRAVRELQEEAVKTGNVDRFRELELIRERLAGELGQPVRTDKEAARLDAQLTTSRGTGAAKLARLHNFETTYQYQRWEINDRRVSLVDVHFEFGRAVDAAKIFGRTHTHFDPSARRAAQKEAERLTGVRERILERIAERRAALEEDALRASVMTAALGAAHAKETLARTEQGRAMPEPLFHKYEIDRLYAAAEEMRDAGLLRDVGRYEKEFLVDRGAKDKRMEGQTVRRATGREVLAEVYSAEAERRLELCEKHPGSHVVVITDQDGQPHTYTPVPGDRKFELDHLLRLAWESSEDRATRRAVDGAGTEQHRRLVAHVQKTREYGAVAHELAAAGRAELTARGTDEKEVWRVELSDKQATDLRVYAERQTDQAARDYYAGLARGERGAYSDRERGAFERGSLDRTQGIDL